jgi:glycosyltransferase involved in cell wall biosynthesis
MGGTKLLVLSSDRVGDEMAGPAIRAYEIARALAIDHDVTLVAPRGSSLPSGATLGFSATSPGAPEFLELAKRHDVLVAQFLPGSVLARLLDTPLRLVFDLYDPRPLEILERGADLGGPVLERRSGAEAAEMLAYLAAADFVVCASERQRDLWIGALTGAGLIDAGRYERDPGYRSFLDVVPFGVPDEPPASAGQVLKGVWPGIGERDRVVVWGGGVWDWLDPLGALKAVELAAERVEGLRLFFLGTGRPPVGEQSSFAAMSSEEELERYARERDLEGRLVFLNRDWVPYSERAGYLLEADLGISTHLDHLEARYAFRTRVLDYLWAGLPVVATEGDVLADLVESESLGRTTPPGNHEALGDAIASLLSDPQELGAARNRIRELTPSLRWSLAVEPLKRFCERPPEPRDGRALRRARALVRSSRRAKRTLILRERGIGGVASEAARHLRLRSGR